MSVIVSPVWPRQSPPLTASLKTRICSSTASTSGMTSRPSTMTGVPARFLSAVCSTALPSVALIFSPSSIASRRLFEADRLGEIDEQPHGLLGDPLLRPVDQKVVQPTREALEPRFVLREEITQASLAQRLGMPLQCLPSRQIAPATHRSTSAALE